MKSALEVMDRYQGRYCGQLLFVAYFICLQKQHVTLFCDLHNVIANRKMLFSCM